MDNAKNCSLKIDRPIGGIILRSVLLLVIVLAAAEAAARTPWLTRRLATPSLGNYHYQFEIKWFHLQRYVQENGGVDIIFLGSSLVNSGVEPAAVNQAWVEASGEAPLRIYNFGVEGLTIEPNSVVAQLLVETYDPKAIVFGTEIRDYAANNGVETAEQFLSDPWIQYRSGNFNLRGWLAEHSAGYRYFLAYRNWMRWDFAENQSNVIKRTKALTPEGYDVENRVAENPYLPPDPNDPEDAEGFEVFGGFEMADSRLEDLDDLLGLMKTSETIVLVVEMPVTPQFFDYFEAGEGAHEEFLDAVSKKVRAAGTEFLPGIPEDQLPENGRSDRVHLSKYGAAVFSRYLGEWLAALYGEYGGALLQPGGWP
ncbi:MAG: hypothetical protein JW757_08580 [Anaerolineales bacterium]|nr:hypothetical protein [Anaerolineales bacterium]